MLHASGEGMVWEFLSWHIRLVQVWVVRPGFVQALSRTSPKASSHEALAALGGPALSLN